MKKITVLIGTGSIGMAIARRVGVEKHVVLADNALCNDAGPISAFGRHPASTQSRFSALRHPFAMMRAEIRKNPRSVAVLRAI
jgi:hypothetical protein